MGGIGRAAARFALVFRRTVLGGVPSTGDEGSWSLRRWFLVAFGVIAAGMIFMGRDYFFGTPLFEYGDLAANSFQIARATHLQEIYGNYSRFGFHHPGPAFFYVYAAGEVLFFNLLHIVPAPHNGHLLAAALLQSAFLATLIAVISRFAAPNRGLFVTGAIAVALVHFQLAGNVEYSIWPPDQLVVPFACFVVVSIAVAWGWIGLLPVLVLCGGFLVHGHVAQPLYVVPLATVACGLGFWRNFHQDALTVRGFIRRNLKSFLVTLTMLAVFLLPLLLDAVHGRNSNLFAILGYLRDPRGNGDMHSPTQVIAYVFSFLGYPADQGVLDFSSSQLGAFVVGRWAAFMTSLVVLIVLPVVLLVTRSSDRGPVDADGDNRSGGSRFFVTYYGFLFLAVALTFIWVVLQKGPLFEFNSFFVYGLMFVSAMPPLLVICRRWPVRTARFTTILIGVLAVGLTASTALPLPNAEDPGGLSRNAAVQAVIAARTSRDAVMLEFEGPEWPEAAAVALALERSNVSWFVEPQWGLMFGADHEYIPRPGPASSPEKWFLAPPAAAHRDQIVLGPAIAIYPRPPSLSTYPRAP
jgi:hypothetical protein